MAMKRRRPGTLPPSLTGDQVAQVGRCFPIAVHVAMYYARRKPKGLTADDLLGAAEEAVTLAVTTHPGSKVDLESYVWARVRSTLKTLIRRTADRLGQQASNDTHESRTVQAAAEALDEHALNMRDRGNFWRDTPEQQSAHYDAAAHDGATALVVGGGGHVWNVRGESGLVLRIEYLRTNKILHDEVARLPAKYATIIELRYFRELPVKEVAAQARVSESTVSRMIEEAIPLLKARLTARGIDDFSCLDGR